MTGTAPQSHPARGSMAKKFREVDVLAVLAAAVCVGLGYLSRQALSPDGVSYLDLAAAMQRGDWAHFVQGYWSPLLPLLTGGIGLLVDRGGPGLVPIAHVLNTIAALAAIAILWHWARAHSTSTSPSPTPQDPRPLGRAFIAAFLLCSAGLPRIEAVTPDVLLLLVLTWLSYELIVQHASRWWLVGILLGISFLTKTSSWPWLLAAIPLRLWAAKSGASRRQVWLSTVTCVAIMATWFVPMTMKYGRPTLGSSGALNYSWYMKGHSSRLPDTDQGTNTAYQDVGVGNGRLLRVATFDDAGAWTYQPWGDPTAWSAKVLTETGRDPMVSEIVLYWLRMTMRVFGLWLGPLIAGAILPWILLRARPKMLHELVTTERNTLVVIGLGLIGLFQFAAIHAEPRLIAPFGLMLALGVVHWCFAAASPETRLTRLLPLRVSLTWLGVVAVIGFGVFRMREALQSAQRLQGVTTQLDELRRRLAIMTDGPVPIAVVGPAAPIMASAFWANAHIVMQVAPPYAALVATLPKAAQDSMILTLFRGKVPMVWRTSADGGMQMLAIPPN